MKETNIGKYIITASNQLRRVVGKELIKSAIDISGPQSRIIKYLYYEGKHREIFQKDIEEEFDIRRSSVTSILQHLEKNGYITREKAVQDGRLKKLMLTKKGIDAHAIVSEVVQGTDNIIVDLLTEEELDLLSDLLSRITHHLNKL